MNLRLTNLVLVTSFGCGDAGTASTSDSSGTGDTGPTPTTGASPTSSSSTSTSSGGQTGGMTTGATDDTGLGPTTDASTSTTTTTSGDTSSGGSSSGGSTETSGTSTGDTTTGEPPGSCLEADFPVTAPLCGDGGPACALLRDELVSGDKAFRNDMPAIALRGDCGPAVLYSVAVGDYFGFYGERTGPDAWAVSPTPMKVATMSLEALPDVEEMLAAVDDGAFGVSVWQRSGGLWEQHSALAGMNHTRAPQLVRDGQDRLRLGHIDADNNMRLSTYDGGWTGQSLLTQTEIHVRIALGPEDAPSLIGWSSEAMTWQLRYLSPPDPPELISNLGSNVLDRHHTALVRAGADATPWVLLLRKQADQQHHDAYLAHRTGMNNWQLELLFAEDPVGDSECGVPPGQPGQLCDYDYSRVYTTTLLASADEVRALYTVVNSKGTYVAECEAFPEPFCYWVPQSNESTGQLRVAWPGAAPADHQVVAQDVFTDRATGRLDTAGAMHLAFYDYGPAGGDPVVRYLMIGAD